jgi:hypothetical protein
MTTAMLRNSLPDDGGVSILDTGERELLPVKTNRTGQRSSYSPAQHS